MKRNFGLRKRCFERDNFTCQKCKFFSENKLDLEAHHVFPLCFGGKDELDNLITLCSDCHKFAPNNPDEFKVYLQEEMQGSLTIFAEIWKKTRLEHPELFDEKAK
jgi:predicted HNH restriction endonuclease